ncbi:histidine kinase [Chitinophaga agrisoli]|uniref:Histidine kinase n=1 Tax=Chitinophaga agrisoli TaxID=2607653 RepID=A0A5B2VMP6_9BACT|nr:histidine kinase [Chitinophaga agrisoli]KAA2239696.1 histidine kinase [Chitinophaga agrisoli]
MRLAIEKKIVLYSSLLVALLVNLPKLLQARSDGWVSQFSTFNVAELCFQFCFTYLYCWLVFELNLHWFPRWRKGGLATDFAIYPLSNILLLLLCSTVGIVVQGNLFSDAHHLPLRFFRVVYFARLSLCWLLEILVIRIIYLLRQAQAKDLETEQIKSQYLYAELELMKQHLNPHFFFNSLSTLSGMIRENPGKAQQFIGHLSRIFRNLLQEQQQLITLKEELQQLHSFTELLQMRFEEGIVISVEVPPLYHQQLLPHLSLQLLVENAAKHNRALASQPLQVRVYVQDNELCVKNNLQAIAVPQASAGLGLANLNERFRILLKKEITIIRTLEYFLVKLPLEGGKGGGY